MRDLNYALKQLCRHNRDGSYATQADREHILDLIADQLHEMGFRHMNAHSLKPKHVEKLVERWLAEELSPGTIKNRMSALRWWAEKIGKENIIARTNAAYGIPDRVYVTNISKAKELVMDQLQQIRTDCIRISLRLQAPSVPRSSDNSSTRRRRWPKARVSSPLATAATATISNIFGTNASGSAFTPSTAIAISMRRHATRN
jgi:hypothetical protein